MLSWHTDPTFSMKMPKHNQLQFPSYVVAKYEQEINMLNKMGKYATYAKCFTNINGGEVNGTNHTPGALYIYTVSMTEQTWLPHSKYHMCDHLHIPCLAIIFIFIKAYEVLIEIHEYFTFGSHILLFHIYDHLHILCLPDIFVNQNVCE